MTSIPFLEISMIFNYLWFSSAINAQLKRLTIIKAKVGEIEEPLYEGAGDSSVILECDTTAAVLGAGQEVGEVVGEEVVLAEDGAFQEVMQVNLQV